jgi:hypothetical protein
MGHKRIDETMLYVNLADAHRRELPPNIVASGARETDRDRRIVAMLGCRGTQVASGGRPKLQVVEIAEERGVGRRGFGNVGESASGDALLRRVADSDGQRGPALIEAPLDCAALLATCAQQSTGADPVV